MDISIEVLRKPYFFHIHLELKIYKLLRSYGCGAEYHYHKQIITAHLTGALFEAIKAAASFVFHLLCHIYQHHDPGNEI